MNIWGYSEIEDLVERLPNVKNGMLVDTNILVVATYDSRSKAFKRIYGRSFVKTESAQNLWRFGIQLKKNWDLIF